MKNFSLKNIVIATIGLTLLSALFDLIRGQLNPIQFYGWVLLANTLLVLSLACYVVNSSLHTTKLWLTTSLIFYIIGNFNILIEAWVFNVTDRTQTLHELIIGIPYCILASLLITYIFSGWKVNPNEKPIFEYRTPIRWGLKILGANFLYFLFYIIAGMILQATVTRFNEYYGDKLPDFVDIIITNMFFRGFVFVAIAILIDRTVQLTALKKALLVGGIFSILGGIAPLIIPNELMPPFIRIAHGFEVGISNFLFGLCAFYILRSRPVTTKPE